MRRIAFFLLPYAALLCGLDISARLARALGTDLPASLFLSRDRGLGEYLEYPLSFAAAAMLFVLWRKTREPLYAANAGLFAYITCDNFLRLHERFGVATQDWWPSGLPLGQHHIGEVALFAIAGGAWLVTMLACWRSAGGLARIHAMLITTLIAVLAVFGVALDALANLGTSSKEFAMFKRWLEDAGEFATLIVTFLVVCAMYDSEKVRPQAAWSAQG